MLRTLEARVARLEARVVPTTTDPWVPRTFPDGWYEDVVRLLQELGYLEAVLRSLPSCPYEEP